MTPFLEENIYELEKCQKQVGEKKLFRPREFVNINGKDLEGKERGRFCFTLLFPPTNPVVLGRSCCLIMRRLYYSYECHEDSIQFQL